MNADAIILAAAHHFGCRACDIIGPGRSKTRIRMRFIVAVLLRDALDLSYPEIAKAIGYKDHTSAMNGVRRARRFIEHNHRWALDYQALRKLAPDCWQVEIQIERLDMCA